MDVILLKNMQILCIDAGLNFEGINQEVAVDNGSFNYLQKGRKLAGDEMWIARYLLDRLTEGLWLVH